MLSKCQEQNSICNHLLDKKKLKKNQKGQGQNKRFSVELLFTSNARVVGSTTERLVAIVDSEGFVGWIIKIFTNKNRRNPYEERVVTMSKSHVVWWNAKHAARVPHQLPVRPALFLRLVLDAFQNAVHPVTEDALLRHHH